MLDTRPQRPCLMMIQGFPCLPLPTLALDLGSESVKREADYEGEAGKTSFRSVCGRRRVNCNQNSTEKKSMSVFGASTSFVQGM